MTSMSRSNGILERILASSASLTRPWHVVDITTPCLRYCLSQSYTPMSAASFPSLDASCSIFSFSTAIWSGVAPRHTTFWLASHSLAFC